MRLINTKNFKLEKYTACPEKKYAILSHRWGREEDEINFEDFKDLASARRKKPKSYSKLEMTVRLAGEQGHELVWIDTTYEHLVDCERHSCCIKVADSREVSNAIRHMYEWYQKSAICYAFLSDLPTSPELRLETFEKCSWWTRGWTLQELIAPTEVEFYDQTWKKCGTRSALQKEIQSITGVPPDAYDEESLDDFSIAQRLSWAARRETTEPEDIAYCLLGLLKVDMQLKYGEREKAFIRLQEEICRKYFDDPTKDSYDMTVFAWSTQISHKYNREYQISQKYWGLFAHHPVDFVGCANVCESDKEQWHNFLYDRSISDIDFCLRGLRLEMLEGHGLLMNVGWYESDSFGDIKLFVPITETVGSQVRSFPGHLMGVLPEDYDGAPVTEIHGEDGMRISIIEGYNGSEKRFLPPSETPFRKRVNNAESSAIDQMHKHAVSISTDSRIQISSANPEKNWALYEHAFLVGLRQALTGVLIMEFRDTAPDAEPDSLILLFDCRRAKKHEGWEYFKYKILGLESRNKQLGHEERRFGELRKRIEKSKMVQFEGYKEVDRIMRKGGGELGDAQKLKPSTWRARQSGYEIRAEVDPLQMASGKVVLKLSVHHTARL